MHVVGVRDIRQALPPAEWGWFSFIVRGRAILASQESKFILERSKDNETLDGRPTLV